MTSATAEDIRRYIEDVEYPAFTQDLLTAAEARGAPQEVIERLRSLGPQHFAGPQAVLTTLQRPQQPGRVPKNPAVSGADGGPHFAGF